MIKLIMAHMLYWLRGLFENPVELFQALGVESDDRILEIGCATGYHTLPLARIASNGRVYAVDIWEEALTHLEHKTASVENVEIICRSAEALAFPPASLDKVVCLDTLHEIPHLEEAVAKWAAFLRQDGKLLYRDPSVPSERLGSLSKGQFRHSETVKGVDVFVRRAPD